MGTRFVASKESIVHENYKNPIIKAKDIDSVVTGMSTGHPVRSLRNQMTREYLKLEKENADFMELEKLTLGSLRRGSAGRRYRKRNPDGRADCRIDPQRTDLP